MLKPRVQAVLNDQVNAEIYSAHLYLLMSSFCENLGLPGAANWMMVQYKEETAHGLMFFKFIHERGGKVDLSVVNKFPQEWKTLKDLFDYTLKHERHVTELINNIVDVALEERDHATNNFIQWFVKEQVEEEANVKSILDKLKLVKDSDNGLFVLDKELAARVFVDPTPAINQP